MSERELRKAKQATIAELIEALEVDAERTEQILGAAKLVHADLGKEPKDTTCKITHEFYQCRRTTAETSHCSECREIFGGWEPNWRFCPGCGSRITSAERESSPNARLLNDAVDKAMANIGER